MYVGRITLGGHRTHVWVIWICVAGWIIGIVVAVPTVGHRITSRSDSILWLKSTSVGKFRQKCASCCDSQLFGDGGVSLSANSGHIDIIRGRGSKRANLCALVSIIRVEVFNRDHTSRTGCETGRADFQSIIRSSCISGVCPGNAKIGISYTGNPQILHGHALILGDAHCETGVGAV